MNNHAMPYHFFAFGGWGILDAFLPLLAIVIVWEIFWKGLALWHAARSRQPVWFIIMLIVNTVGILEIVYLIWFRGDKNTGTLFDHPKNPSSHPTTSPAPASDSSPQA